MFDLLLAHPVNQYFVPEVYLKDNELIVQCTSAGGFVVTECTVQYSTNPMYRNLSNEITVPVNIEFSILEIHSSSATYYFLFTAFVNNTLEVSQRFIFNFSAKTGK